VTSVDAVQPALPLATGLRPPLPSPPSRPPAPAEDPSEISVKIKIAEDLMANGDVAAARMMFQRAAEAGDAAAAFALAETYDPLVLSRLRLRGGIAPDVALARRWYEKARDLGSVTAPDRIVRLTQLPQ
jgi:TPR repeat protein